MEMSTFPKLFQQLSKNPRLITLNKFIIPAAEFREFPIRDIMKLKTLLTLSPIFLAVALSIVVGCTRYTPVSIPNPVPAPQFVLSNGVAGTWFGNVVTPSPYGGCAATPAVVAVTDSVSGDPNSLQLTTANTCGFYVFSIPVTVNLSAYYPIGHFQFDIMLGIPSSNFSSIKLEFLDSTSITDDYYYLPTSLINSLSTTSFTHISIPITSFKGNYALASGINTPFQITWVTSSASSSLTMDDIVWTAN